jgi:hypothetical protein
MNVENSIKLKQITVFRHATNKFKRYFSLLSKVFGVGIVSRSTGRGLRHSAATVNFINKVIDFIVRSVCP